MCIVSCLARPAGKGQVPYVGGAEIPQPAEDPAFQAMDESETRATGRRAAEAAKAGRGGNPLSLKAPTEPFAEEAEDGAQMSSGLSHTCSKRYCSGTTSTESLLAYQSIIAMFPFQNAQAGLHTKYKIGRLFPVG